MISKFWHHFVVLVLIIDDYLCLQKWINILLFTLNSKFYFTVQVLILNKANSETLFSYNIQGTKF